MTIIETFAADPSAFLTTNVVIVSDGSEHDGKAVGTANFFMSQGPHNSVTLNRRGFGSTQGTLKAYWLPWKTGTGIPLDLGDKAEWLFTSEMTDCRFSILSDKDDNAIKVAHVAGGMSRAGRDQWEEEKFITDKAQQKKLRRMSRSDKSLHGYAGQIGADSTSAFVFGRRESGAWKFYMQIVKGAHGFGTTNVNANLDIVTVMSPLGNLTATEL